MLDARHRDLSFDSTDLKGPSGGNGNITVVAGGVAYGTPFIILGMKGFSFTPLLTGTNSGLKFRVEYTDWGNSDSVYPSDYPPLGASAKWGVWDKGTIPYADGPIQDTDVHAKWARVVLDDTGGASSGTLTYAVTLRSR